MQGNTFDANVRPESFSLLYFNPPYDSEIGSIGNRRMEAVFLEHTYRWLAIEGVLALVIPLERLHDCVGNLGSHFTAPKTNGAEIFCRNPCNNCDQIVPTVDWTRRPNLS